MSVPFYKLSATGNDFVVIDHREKFLQENDLPEFVKRVCAYHTGVGADGLLLLENHQQADFRMRYFNGDGSHATMCGNGARAICWFARELNIWNESVTFLADDGMHRAEADTDRIGVTLNIEPSHTMVELNDRGKGWSINTGVPHLVLFSEDLEHEEVSVLGKKYRWDSQFQPEGTNVNFVQVKNGSVQVRTYERGVEDETLACGTGVMASSIIAGQESNLDFPMQITVAGGDLEVTRHEDEWMLWGEVDLIFTGNLILKNQLDKFIK
jgi:diaminopimelate epimerase